MTAGRAAIAFDVRHGLRLQAFEAAGGAVLVAFLAAACIGVAGLVDATGYGTHCQPLGANDPACEAMGRSFYGLQSSIAMPLRALLLAVPFLGAVVLGAPLVARELERGTGRLVWSLTPSRARWFLARLLPVLALVAALGVAAGAGIERVSASLVPWEDLGQSFTDVGWRGLPLAARVVFVFAIAVAAGAVLGRTLPALLLAAVLGWTGLTGGAWVHGRWLASEAVYVEDAEGGGPRGALWVDQRLRDDRGRILTWDEAYAVAPPDPDTEEWPPAGWTFLNLVVPGERYPLAAAREVAALGGGSVLALGIAALAVRRRRPA